LRRNGRGGGSLPRPILIVLGWHVPNASVIAAVEACVEVLVGGHLFDHVRPHYNHPERAQAKGRGGGGRAHGEMMVRVCVGVGGSKLRWGRGGAGGALTVL
jgi:hypothetical protein